MSNNLKNCPVCGVINSISETTCIKCGFHFIDMESEKFEFRELPKKYIARFLIALIFAPLFVITMIFATVGFVEKKLYETDESINLMVVLGSGWFFALCLSLLLTPPRGGYREKFKKRKFTITNDYITIQIPNREIFQINWSDFDSIVIKIRSEKSKLVNNFIFEGKEFFKNYEIDTSTGFSHNVLKKIKTKLQELANDKNIQYVCYRDVNFVSNDFIGV